MKKEIIAIGLLFFLAAGRVVMAQDDRYGTLSGSFETNSIYYMYDSKSNATTPKDRFGSNNYLKFDYQIGKFGAGLMYEAYLPVLQGFPVELKNSDIVYKYAMFSDFGLTVLAGDFYEQYGSGLLFRSYEERSLGLNNSIEGVKVNYAFGDKVMFKAFYGRPRLYMERAESQMRGADISINLSSCLGITSSTIFLEGSYLNRYQRLNTTKPGSIDPNVSGYSARLAWDYNGISLKGEYVTRDHDAASYNGYSDKKGNALLVEAGYVNGGFGGLVSLRRLEMMEFRSTREATGIGTSMNYLPALTRQYTYMLASLNPYTPLSSSEIGGQLDLYYNFARGTALGGKYGMKVGLNASLWHDLKFDDNGDYEMFAFGDELLFQDINLDIVKTWSPEWKTTLTYSMQTYNPSIIGKQSAEWKSHIVVADVTWKINRRNSIRMELQHLATKQDKKNWMAALLEYNVAPRWSLFVSDMYNYGNTDDLHYYNGGVSYTHSRTRIALNYGRSRDGYTCAGGVCRATPAYTGFNLALTTSF